MPDSTTSGNPRTVTYRCHPGVAWVVEAGGIILVRADMGRTLGLDYPEAALWDMLSRGIPLGRLNEIIAAIAGIESGKGKAWVRQTIGDWAREGWLVEGRNDG